MTTTLNTTDYDLIRYPGQGYTHTHPARTGLVAHLFGLTPPPLHAARVLELGCGDGWNLIPMAELAPEATFVGVDLAASAIAEGQATAAELDLANVRLIAADFAQLPNDFGTFDYIIAHGVYSWVPAPARDALLALIFRHLAPDGIAYVSYNANPGWHLRTIVREMMLWHGRHIPQPLGRAVEGRELLDAIAAAVPDREPAYKAVIAAERAVLARVPDYYLVHDHLSPDNAAFWLHEFVDLAARAGLQYLGDADLEAMLGGERLANDVRAPFDRWAHDHVDQEQYLDFAVNQFFRRSLLVHFDRPITRHVIPDRLAGLHLATHLTPVDPADPDTVFASGETRVERASRFTRAALHALAAAYPAPVPFDALVAQALARLPAGDAPPDDPAHTLGGDLLRLLSLGLVGATAFPFPNVPRSERPRASRAARLQCARRYERATTLRHGTVNLKGGVREILRLCDGTRDRDALFEEAATLCAAGVFKVTEDDVPATDPAHQRRLIDTVLDDVLHALAREGFFLA